MAIKQYLSLEGLQQYDELIKQKIDDSVKDKADSSHNHDDKYYTETEIDTKLANKSDTNHNHDSLYDAKGAAAEVQTNLNTVSDTLNTHTGNSNIHVTTTNKSNWNAAYDHSQAAHARTDATKTASSTTNGNILINGTETKVYTHPNSNVTAGTYKSVTVNAQGHVTSGTNPTTLAGYGITDAEAKGAANTALASAKEYTDTKTSGLASTSNVSSAISTHNSATDAHSDIRATLAEVKEDVDAFFKDATISTEAKDTLKEIQDYISSDVAAAAAMTASINNKADKATTLSGYGITNAYTKGEVDSALSGKADSSHGTHVTFDSTNKPKMDGTAAFGTSTNVARADHVHPTDTSRAAKSDFDTHVADTTKHITSTERTNWGTAYTHSQAAHAPSNAQANVIESIKVNGTAQTITSKAVNITVPTDNASLTNGAGYLVASDIANKANKSTTLSGYGITNAYTKDEVDAKTAVDSSLSSTSTKPVQNKVVNSAISTLTSTVSANTSSISAHTTAINNLQTAVGEIQEITSAEISALFNS